MSKENYRLGYIIWLSFVAALGGFLFGYDTAVISGTVDQVASQFSLDDFGKGWFVGCALVGSIGGVVIAGPLSDRYGRKIVLLLSAILFTASGIGCMIAADEMQLIIFRIMGGVGIGVASVISPLYIAEVSVPRYRGQLVSLYQLAITIGFLGAYLANFGLLNYSESLIKSGATQGLYHKIFATEAWRGMLGMEALPALLFFLILFLIPESPRWLIVRGKESRALGIMTKIYRGNEIQVQIKNVKDLITEEVKSDWRLLFQPGFRLALFIGVALAILGQFMGVNAVLYYGPTIFKESGLSSGDSLFYQVMVGLVNMLTTVLALIIIDRVGRKQLVYWGVSGMIITLICIGIYFTFGAAWGLSVDLSSDLLFALHLLLCYFHLCGHFCTSFRNVSSQSQGCRYVNLRSFALDWNVLDWTVNSMDVDQPDTCRNFLVICPDVPAIHVDCLETIT